MKTLNPTALYIDGKHTQASSGETFNSYNPATGELLAKVQQAAMADVDTAVRSAERGFAIWSQMSPTHRGQILLRAVAILRERNDELAMLEVLDTGTPIQEADCVDIESGAEVIEYYAGLAVCKNIC